jgi:putative hemolysin
MAAARIGFHASTLFELTDVPESMLAGAVEFGRACLHPAHRNGAVIDLLWRGTARYMEWNSARYAFGTCSLTGTSPQTALTAWRTVHARRLLHDRVLVKPKPYAIALADDPSKRPLIDASAIDSALPPLFESYLGLGARVCSAPAFDHALGCTDLLVMLELALLDNQRIASLFEAA